MNDTSLILHLLVILRLLQKNENLLLQTTSVRIIITNCDSGRGNVLLQFVIGALLQIIASVSILSRKFRHKKGLAWLFSPSVLNQPPEHKQVTNNKSQHDAFLRLGLK